MESNIFIYNSTLWALRNAVHHFTTYVFSHMMLKREYMTELMRNSSLFFGYAFFLKRERRGNPWCTAVRPLILKKEKILHGEKLVLFSVMSLAFHSSWKECPSPVALTLLKEEEERTRTGAQKFSHIYSFSLPPSQESVYQREREKGGKFSLIRYFTRVIENEGGTKVSFFKVHESIRSW